VTDWLVSIVVGLNRVSNALGRMLAPIGVMPGWLSATLVAVATGVAMLVMFKFTSNQRAIKGVRRSIRANRMAAGLFKDNFRLGIRSQIRVVLGALHLLLLALVPMLVMTVPMVLLLAQLGQWYQTAPLPVGGEAVVTAKFNSDAGAPMPAIELAPDNAFEDLSGPVRVVSQGEICWSIRAKHPGYHTLRFRIDGRTVEKELAVGKGVMRVSTVRPGPDWSQVLLNPLEEPFDGRSTVRSIGIEYPARSGWASGPDNWVIYWFVVSLVAGFCLRGALKVNF